MESKEEKFDQATFDEVMAMDVKEIVQAAFKAGLMSNERRLKYLLMGADSFDQVIEKMNQVIQDQVDAAKALAKDADKSLKAKRKQERQNRKAGR